MLRSAVRALTYNQARMLTLMRNSFATENEVELTTENAIQIIDKMVKQNKICLFMKGTPEAPTCGYSNFVV